MVMRNMATGFVVLRLDRDRRICQVPIQRRDGGTHRDDPDRQSGDKTIAYVPSCPPHINRLEGDERGVNGSLAGPRLAYGMAPNRGCVPSRVPLQNPP